MSITCPVCHYSNPEDTNFCGKCSASLKERKTRGEGATETMVEPRQTSLKTGSLVAGRYEIIELLGRGGMGKVYKAHDLDVDLDIALKVIRRDLADNPQIIQRFQNELKLARQVSHRNVCRMFDLGKDGPTQYITMEYVPGEDLKTTIHRIGPMTIPKALDIGKQICQGLSEAHACGVIHRDLKPSNVIVDREGNVRIMDFGIAVSPSTEGLTDPDGAPGTVDYLAPELLEGQKAGPASDIYSLGVILYEMVTGKLPFHGDSTYAVAVKHLTGTPKDPSGFNPLVPPALSRLIMKCLAKDPAKRFREASEVCAELSRIGGGLPKAEGGNFLQQLWAKVRARPILKWGLTVILLLAVAAAAKRIIDRRDGNGTQGLVNSVIVLPFKNLNMTEADIWPQVLFVIIKKLEMSGLMVVPYHSVVPKASSPGSDLKIAREFKVNNILKGSMALKDGKIEFVVELRRMRPDGVLFNQAFWSLSEKDYDGALDAIATAVADKLGATLSPGRAAPTPTNPEAKRYYSYGLHRERAYLNSEKAEDFEAAVMNYQKALDFEPGSAIVHWRLGMLYEGRFNELKKESDEKLMMQHLQQAYASDPRLAESNLAMGWYYFNREDHDRAYPYFKKALEIDRDSVEVNNHVGSFLRSLGLYEQARKHYGRALGLAPAPDDFAVWHQLLADCDSQLGEVTAGAQLLRTAIDINDYRLNLDYAVCLIKMKEYAEAEKQIKTATGQGADADSIRLRRALLHAAMGQREAAIELMKTETDLPHPLVTSTNALLGFRDRAIQGIEASRGTEGFKKYRWYRYTYLVLLNNPFFENLRGEPAFQTILAKEKAIFEARIRKFSDL